MTIFCDFSKKFPENLNYFFSDSGIPTLYLVPARVLPRIANLASKYDCSNPCSFRDMTIFVIFSKFFRQIKLIIFQNLNFATL